jgi:hypothetical protein
MFYHTKINKPVTAEEIKNAEKYSVGIAVIGVVIKFIAIVLILAQVLNMGTHFAGWFIVPSFWKTVVSYIAAFLLAYGLMELAEKFAYMAAIMVWQKTLKGVQLDALSLGFFIILSLSASYTAMRLDAEGFSHFYMSQHTVSARIEDEKGATVTADSERERILKVAKENYDASVGAITSANNKSINEINRAAAAAIKSSPWKEKQIREKAKADIAKHTALISEGVQMAEVMKNQTMTNAWEQAKKRVSKVEEGNKKEQERVEKEKEVAKSAGLSLAGVLIPLLLIIIVCGARLDILTGHVKTFSLKEAFYKKGAVANLVTNLGKFGNAWVAIASNMVANITIWLTPKVEKDDVEIERAVQGKKPMTLNSVGRALNGKRDSDEEFDEEAEWNRRLQKKNMQ